MKNNIVLLGSFLLCSAFAVGQSKKDIVADLTSNKPGQGKVRVFQDPRIEALLKSSTAEVVQTGDKSVIRANGYRIQVYAGNNTREARNHAVEIGQKVSELFPDLSVYTSFVSPRWICRVGDFRSIEEADAVLRELRSTNKFREVSIVRELIQIPLD